jgi:hypothetical protein
MKAKLLSRLGRLETWNQEARQAVNAGRFAQEIARLLRRRAPRRRRKARADQHAELCRKRASRRIAMTETYGYRPLAEALEDRQGIGFSRRA